MPAKVGELLNAMAETLAHHMSALDLTDGNARWERDAYQELRDTHRQIAAQLSAAAGRMAAIAICPWLITIPKP